MVDQSARKWWALVAIAASVLALPTIASSEHGQYFQEVQGANAMGSGLRLLPMIGGLVVGMIGSTRLASPRGSGDLVRAPLASVKGLVTGGFAIMTAALAVGACTTAGSGTGFAAAWLAAFGLGLGLAMPQTMNRSEERR